MAKVNLDKLRNRKVTLAKNPELETVHEKKGEQNTEKGANENQVKEEAKVTPSVAIPVETAPIELPGKIKRVLTQNEVMASQSKANLQTYEYLINEFNHIRNYAKTKKMKTTVTAMVSNILQEWLSKNADELEKTIGYKPLQN